MKLNFKNTLTQYGLIARLLHWTSVSLLVAVVILASQFEDLVAGPDKSASIILHSSMGFIFFGFMLTRVAWRNTNHNPIKSYTMKKWQKLIAISLHRSIYIILITQCVLGIAILITGGEQMHFFSLLEFGPIMGESSFLNRFTLNVHHFISILIYPLFAVHISAAIYHQIFGVADD